MSFILSWILSFSISLSVIVTVDIITGILSKDLEDTSTRWGKILLLFFNFIIDIISVITLAIVIHTVVFRGLL